LNIETQINFQFRQQKLRLNYKEKSVVRNNRCWFRE